MSWIDKILPPRIKREEGAARKQVPEGLWTKCPSCEAVLYSAELQKTLQVCPKCSFHMRIGARERLDALLDAEGRYEIGQDVVPVDALKFKDSRKYPERLQQAMNDTGDNVLALSYRIVINVLGCYLSARLAPRNPMRHALILGVIGLVLSTVGAIGAIAMKMGPAWYPILLALSALPCAWLGGMLHTRRSRASTAT